MIDLIIEKLIRYLVTSAIIAYLILLIMMFTFVGSLFS